MQALGQLLRRVPAGDRRPRRGRPRRSTRSSPARRRSPTSRRRRSTSLGKATETIGPALQKSLPLVKELGTLGKSTVPLTKNLGATLLSTAPGGRHPEPALVHLPLRRLVERLRRVRPLPARAARARHLPVVRRRRRATSQLHRELQQGEGRRHTRRPARTGVDRERRAERPGRRATASPRTESAAALARDQAAGTALLPGDRPAAAGRPSAGAAARRDGATSSPSSTTCSADERRRAETPRSQRTRC